MRADTRTATSSTNSLAARLSDVDEPAGLAVGTTAFFGRPISADQSAVSEMIMATSTPMNIEISRFDNFTLIKFTKVSATH